MGRRLHGRRALSGGAGVDEEGVDDAEVDDVEVGEDGVLGAGWGGARS